MSQFNSRNIKTFPCCNKGWGNELVPVRQTEALYLLLVSVARAWMDLPMGGSCGAALEPQLSAVLFALVLQQGKSMRKMKFFPVYKESG